jgi:hypothetical protein
MESVDIYVVVAEEDAYSNRWERLVRAFHSDADAQALATACETHVAEAYVQPETWMHGPRTDWGEDDWRTWRDRAPDPDYREGNGPSSTYGTSYRVETVPLVGTPSDSTPESEPSRSTTSAYPSLR